MNLRKIFQRHPSWQGSDYRKITVMFLCALGGSGITLLLTGLATQYLWHFLIVATLGLGADVLAERAVVRQRLGASPRKPLPASE